MEKLIYFEHIAYLISLLRIMPRIMIGLYGYLFYDVTTWFMNLADPTMAQAAFVSTMVGAGAGFFGLYMSNGGNISKPEKRQPESMDGDV